MLIFCVKLDRALYSINYGSTCALLVAKLGFDFSWIIDVRFLGYVNKITQALQEQTGVTWNKRFKKQFGPINKVSHMIIT